MADKDFVVKNGMSVNGAVLVVNSGSSSVGIGTNAPDATLKVSGTANVTGDVAMSANLTVSGTITGTLVGTANNASYLGGTIASSYALNSAVTANAATAYSNAIAIASNATTITSGTLDTARLPATVNVSSNLNIGANVNLTTSQIKVGNATVAVTLTQSSITGGANATLNIVTATALSGNGSSVTSVDAATVGGNTAATLRSYSDSTAATAFSNAVANATANAASVAATAYTNAASYADTKASTAYSNAASYADTKASTAYSNAADFAANATNISSGTLNTARLPATVNVSTGVNVGSNVSITTSQYRVGNATIAVTVNSTAIVGGANAVFNNTTSTTLNVGSGNSTTLFAGANASVGVGINTTSPAYTLDVNGGDIIGNNIRLRGGSALYWESYGGGWYMIDSTYIRAQNDKNIYTNGVVQVGAAVLGNNGDMYMPWYGGYLSTALSDTRLKRNVVDMRDSYGLDTVMQFRTVEFDWIDEERSKKGRQIGLIAQEVANLVPTIVNTGTQAFDIVDSITKEKISVKDPKSVSYDKLTVLLIKAVQEMKAEINELKAEIASLKG